MASAVFFLDLKGKTLLARNYRGDIPMSAVEKFPILLSEAEEESSAVPPCFSDEGINVRAGDHIRVKCRTDHELVPLYPTQQPIRPRTHKTEHKCR